MSLACLNLVQGMNDEALARSAGQIYYDFALREPSVLVGTAQEIGKKILATLIEGDKWSPPWGDIVHRYIEESLVGHSPNALVVAIIRLAAIKSYLDDASEKA